MGAVEAPSVGEAAVALALYAAFLVAFGLLYVWRHTLGAVLQTFAAWAGSVSIGAGPVRIHPLGPISDAAEWLDKAVDNALSVAVDNTQRGSLILFHLAAHQLHQLGEMIGGGLYDVAQAFTRTATVTIPQAIYRAQHVAIQRIVSLERTVTHAIASTLPAIEHRISTLDRARQAAEAAAAREAATLSHDVAVVLPHEIGVADAWIGRTAKQVRAHARRLANIEALLTVAGVAALVNVALSTLKLDWIKCPSLSRISKKHGCRPWQILEHLLAPAFDVLIAMNVCDVAKLINAAATLASPVLTELVAYGNAALCHGSIDPLPPLRLATTANAVPVAALAL